MMLTRVLASPFGFSALAIGDVICCIESVSQSVWS